MTIPRRALFAGIIAAAAFPAGAQAPTPAPPPAQPPTSDDGVEQARMGDEVELTARPAIVLRGAAPWDDLYGTFRRSIGEIRAIARDQGLEIAGPTMIRFVSSNDDTIAFETLLPVTATEGAIDRFAPAVIGETPGGRAWRFVHLGGYDTIELTYDEIANFLDDRNIVAEDAFVEEYIRDPETTPETELATYIYVFPRR